MAKRGIYIILAVIAVALSNEIEDAEQKKRGAGKPNHLNSIPTGAQKPDYTYNIYSQSPNIQSNPVQTYQNLQGSFYPSTESNSYYSNADSTSSHPSHSQLAYSQPTQSQFVPINFIPSSGYQSKYQLIPAKSNGNIQLAIVQQPQSYPTTSLLQYPHNIFSTNSNSNIGQPNNQIVNPFPASGQYSFNPNIQTVPIGGSLFGQPSTMILIPQTNPSLYNNLLYPNPSQSFYNYYPTQSQAKYSYASGSPNTQATEYDKGQTAISQGVSKEDTDVHGQGSEYLASAETNSGYKNNYSRRSTYTKFK